MTAPIGLNLTDASVGGNVYHLYVTKMCQGNLTSDHDPNSPVILSRCDPYSDQNNGSRNETPLHLVDAAG